MDFSLTSAQKALRKEFEEFFEEAMKEAPSGWRGGLENIFLNDENWAFHRLMARKLAEKGWLVLSWPKEYGGKNASPIEEMIFREVAGYHRAPGVDIFGVCMIGPAILAFGSPEQKAIHLPLISQGEKMWSQGWSEPNAGSDLAQLTTSAVREGESYIVNGQKVWTSSAHRADWIFMVVRTDPQLKRNKGLSFLLVDLRTPGITIRPILNMDGSHSFNEVFFDDVKVPVTNRLGEENEGWAVVRAVMNLERSSVGDVALLKRDLDELIEFCKEKRQYGEPLIQDPYVRDKLVDLYIESEVARGMGLKTTWLLEKKELQQSEAIASAAKLFTTEMGQRLAYSGSKIMGLYGQVKKGSKYAPLNGSYEQSYQMSIGNNIAAGSSEIQKNLIAWTALDLPRK